MIPLRSEIDLRNEPEMRQRKDRIADLATLPVFFNLRGRKVVLAGASNGAAWKAELLAATGAIVHVYCKDPEETLMQLLDEAHSESRHYVWHRHDWTPDSFNGALLAIGDIEEAEEAERFVASANAAGAVANIIDNPDHCQFQFGSIVNRSPVVISISTDGCRAYFRSGHPPAHRKPDTSGHFGLGKTGPTIALRCLATIPGGSRTATFLGVFCQPGLFRSEHSYSTFDRRHPQHIHPCQHIAIRPCDIY